MLADDNSNVQKEQIELQNGTDLERCGSPIDGPEIAIEGTEPDGPVNLFKPAEGTIGARIYWYVMWLGNLIFFLTIPDVRRKGWRPLYPLAFFICILWIGTLSYLVAWFITVIGKLHNTVKIL